MTHDTDTLSYAQAAKRRGPRTAFHLLSHAEDASVFSTDPNDFKRKPRPLLNGLGLLILVVGSTLVTVVAVRESIMLDDPDRPCDYDGCALPTPWWVHAALVATPWLGLAIPWFFWIRRQWLNLRILEARRALARVRDIRPLGAGRVVAVRSAVEEPTTARTLPLAVRVQPESPGSVPITFVGVRASRRTRASELDLKDARVHLWQGPDGWVFGQAAKVQP